MTRRLMAAALTPILLPIAGCALGVPSTGGVADAASTLTETSTTGPTQAQLDELTDRAERAEQRAEQAEEATREAREQAGRAMQSNGEALDRAAAAETALDRAERRGRLDALTAMAFGKGTVLGLWNALLDESDRTSVAPRCGAQWPSARSEAEEELAIDACVFGYEDGVNPRAVRVGLDELLREFDARAERIIVGRL